MPAIVEDILHNKGGVDANDLTKTIDLDSFEIQYQGAKTKYYELNDLNEFLIRNKNVITILSLNTESLNAKFDEIKLLIDHLSESESFFSIICIQEAWLSDDTPINQFQLPNYQMYTQPYSNQCSIKGGLVTYVRNSINVGNIQNFNNFNTWEGLLIDILDCENNLVQICNIYRPPKGNNNHASIDSFLQEFCPIIDNTTRQNKNLILAGDFNIDLLKLNTNGKYQEFYDFITGHNLLPNITLPTRLSKRSATLIDNIFSCNSNFCTPIDTGILVHKLSDHMATLSAINFNTPSNHNNNKWIKLKSFTGDAIHEFINDLRTTDWTNIFDHDLNVNPLVSYDEKFSTKLESLMNKHFPQKTIKFNKYKHKKTKWITQEIINKIKLRDKLYKRVHSIAPEDVRFNILKDKLQDCTIEIRAMIRNAKKIYYHREFSKNKRDIQKTWDTVKDVLNKARIYKDFPKYFITNNGQVTDKADIAEGFNNFFVNIGPDLAN